MEEKIISEIKRMLRDSIGIDWGGVTKKRDRDYVVITITDNVDNLVKTRGINVFKSFPVENLDHGIEMFKRVFMAFNKTEADESVIVRDILDKRGDLFLVAFI